jgi:hypothetical protein
VKRIYIAESLVDGQLMVDGLCDAGVPAELFHQNASGGLGELPVTYPEVWIRRNLDLEKALKIVTQMAESSTVTHQRNCAQCGEVSPSNFEICWQCHAPFPVKVD